MGELFTHRFLQDEIIGIVMIATVHRGMMIETEKEIEEVIGIALGVMSGGTEIREDMNAGIMTIDHLAVTGKKTDSTEVDGKRTLVLVR